MSLLIAILMLGFIIFVHELGHFLSAKFFKIPVSEFAVGMGPQVCAMETKDTMYSIRAIPIGGYVNIEGMEVESKVENGFNTKPAYQRLIVLFAGVFMNFLTAFILLFFTVKLSGKVEYEKQAYVGVVSEKSINHGILLVNDRILEIDGEKIEKWDDIPQKIVKIKDKTDILVKIERDGEEKKLDLKLMKDEINNRYVLGISPITKKIELSFKESFVHASIALKNIFIDTLNGFVQLFGGKANFKEISGPVGIFKVIGEMSKFGFFTVASLAVVLSVNIGILNLLPIPALDGGRILFVLFEMLGFKVNKKWEENLHRGGMVILIFFIILISTNDILKIFN
ncbi:M50 family metallopeptidase [Fusobacterium sp.]|uniref:M50 family metallopeptidase n=1 Tax=Fusobacterium sp. TaxID=68766 RepID=UPI0025BE6616|nr:M50 family metallopeptidase [Fusobacterium sp.]MCI5724965.1 M50 family metallopeptidase [Fusobacterium sp.]